MDNNSLDLGAIAGFVSAGATLLGAIIASGFAWHISEKWYDQKGKEVIANEAKNLVKMLNKLDRENNDIYKMLSNNNIHNNDENIISIIKQLNRDLLVLQEEIEFFSDCINQININSHELLMDNVFGCRKSGNSYDFTYSKREKFISEFHICRYETENGMEEVEENIYEKELQIININLNFYIQNLKSCLMPYSIYKFIIPKSD